MNISFHNTHTTFCLKIDGLLENLANNPAVYKQMVEIYLLELVKSVYERKNKWGYFFHDAKSLSVVLCCLLNGISSNYRVLTLDLEDNECLDAQELARENTKKVEEFLEEKREMDLDWVIENLIHSRD